MCIQLDSKIDNVHVQRDKRIDEVQTQMGREHDGLALKVDAIDQKLSSHITDYEIHSPIT